MPNLLRFVLGLVLDETSRAAFRTDPDAALSSIEGGLDDLTGEDVDAVVELVRRHVGGELGARIDAGTPTGTDPGESARASVLRHLHAVCDSVEADGPGRGDDGDASGPAGVALADQPPGTRRLWAIDGEAGDEPAVDPTHPAVGGGESAAPTRPGLSAVPEPEGGFAFDPLELVRVVDGIEEDGIEPGALATVIARHPSLDGGIDYEIEVADDDGARRYLGVVRASALERA